MCRQACPVGHVSHRETYTPHAWALTIESVKRRQLTWNQESVGVLYACADCGLCQAHCATDQPLPDAIAASRATVVEAGAAPASVRALDEKLRRDAGLYGKAALAARSQAGAALFVGDAAHFLGSRSVEAAVRLLEAAGVRTVPVGVGQSTGALASSVGLKSTATTLAEVVVAEVKATTATEVLVLTVGDRWAFEHVYPRRLGVSWPRDVVIKDVVSVLGDALSAGTLRFGTADDARPWAYHDPCHSVRVARDAAAPRDLLAAVLGRPGQKTFWREQRAHPCGATSGLEYTHPELADALADARLADAAASGATQLITEDPLCLHHLSGRKSQNVEVLGLYEVLSKHLQ